jgi:hypothetical protein
MIITILRSAITLNSLNKLDLHLDLEEGRWGGGIAYQDTAQVRHCNY